MTLSRSNCDLFMNQMSFTIVNNRICPDWYLNLGPLDLQSNTLPLCHRGCWQLVLITLVGLFNDSFAISRTAYLFNITLSRGDVTRSSKHWYQWPYKMTYHWRIQGGVPGTRTPPGGPNSFIFMQFWVKIGKIIAILGVGAPPWGKSWIRHCLCLLKFLKTIFLMFWSPDCNTSERV